MSMMVGAVTTVTASSLVCSPRGKHVRFSSKKAAAGGGADVRGSEHAGGVEGRRAHQHHKLGDGAGVQASRGVERGAVALRRLVAGRGAVVAGQLQAARKQGAGRMGMFERRPARPPVAHDQGPRSSRSGALQTSGGGGGEPLTLMVGWTCSCLAAATAAGAAATSASASNSSAAAARRTGVIIESLQIGWEVRGRGGGGRGLTNCHRTLIIKACTLLRPPSARATVSGLARAAAREAGTSVWHLYWVCGRPTACR